ncbi:PHA/PHB synthase family protein [Kerstersia sp.]|uniref:PHA/PHB synthase family protein n=1 Tax=Kerstersia sp. TaxID=1930783 RepID=UPI003F9363D5
MTDTPLSQELHDAAAQLDQSSYAALARMTGGLSPASMLLAAYDWGLHLAMSPGKQLSLGVLAARQYSDLLCTLPQMTGACEIQSIPQDRRFSADAWQQWPYSFWQKLFLAQQQWWQEATTGIRGVSKHHENVIAFAARQWLDVFSPGNQWLTNPVVQQQTREQGGANLYRGMMHLLDDIARLRSDEAPEGAENYIPGKQVAATPGKVVLRNQLMELIQYSPATPKVYAEPVLIVPAWIMKYYILDLSPDNSLIKYLVDQGHTVFCVSWKNPGTAERDLGMDDYLQSGVFAALTAVNAIVPQQRVHAVGYCLGGTLLAIAAAAMARDQDERLASLTLFAAQTDFSEPGELSLFIDESQVNMLEAQMRETGYLKGSQMAGAFQMLRSYDLLWSKMVNDYLLGDRRGLNDLMAWNADATRMPARMHSEYLRRLFLDNDLAHGRYPVGKRPVAVSDISLPIFAVGTMTDHVAPWKSVYKLHHLTTTEITFVLTSGGHNAGIVSPPGHPRRHYQIATHAHDAPYQSPEDWQASAPRQESSWWPAWEQWLAQHSAQTQVKPPAMGAAKAGYRPLEAAPGQYVLEK